MEAPPPQLVDPEALEHTATGVGVAPRRPSCLLTEAGGSRGLQGYRGRGRRIADSLADALPGESGGPRSVRLPHGAPHLLSAPQPSDDPLLDTVGNDGRSARSDPGARPTRAGATAQYRRSRGSPELDAELRIEREANRARCRVTHWMVPSASARSPREPRFLRVLSDYDVARSAFKTKMWAYYSRVTCGSHPRQRLGGGALAG
jgi:hypothetical protein